MQTSNRFVVMAKYALDENSSFRKTSRRSTSPFSRDFKSIGKRQKRIFEIANPILYRKEESSFCNAKPTGFNFCECFGRHGIRQLSEGIRRVQTKTEDTDPSVHCIRRQSLRTSSIDTSSFAVESRCYEFRSSVQQPGISQASCTKIRLRSRIFAK